MKRNISTGPYKANNLWQILLCGPQTFSVNNKNPICCVNIAVCITKYPTWHITQFSNPQILQAGDFLSHVSHIKKQQWWGEEKAREEAETDWWRARAEMTSKYSSSRSRDACWGFRLWCHRAKGEVYVSKAKLQTTFPKGNCSTH